MPITKSAKKAIRGSLRKRGHNDRRRREMRDIVKKIDKMSKTDKEGAKKMLSSAFKAIDKAAQKGVIKKNNASNKKSRLSRMLNK